MSFRYANAFDLNKVYEVMQKSFGENEAPGMDFLSFLFQIGKICLCIEDDKIIGVSCYFKLSSCNGGLKLTFSKQFCKLNNVRDIWYIGYICIIPEFRGKKMGKTLMDKVIDNIVKMDGYVEYIGLSCRRMNIIAQNLYKKCGFDMSDMCRMNQYEDPLDDELFMYKKIEIGRINKMLKTILFK